MTPTQQQKIKELERFEYKDVDFIFSPSGWLEAKLKNKLSAGFEIWRDEKSMSWKGVKKYYDS